MKKKICLIFSLLLILIPSLSSLVYGADTHLNDISIHTTLNNDGNAHVQEIWDINIEEGTEIYKVFDNMGDSHISNFNVVDDQGKRYQNIGEWDVDLDKEDKDGKCGMIQDGDRYELCFGIGEYGRRTYTFEYDIANVSPGRFWCGDYYADGYIRETDVEKSGTWNTWTDIKATLYCPYPFWVKEQKKSFYPEDRNHGEAYEFLEYPYDYLYDYSRQKSGSQNWIIDHFKKSNFKMIIYGPCTDPRITINGHVYQIYDTLESSDYVVIESRDKKITKHLANGTTQNILFKRRKDVSVFEPLPFGNLLINWNGEFGFDITAYLERSVPEWI